MEYVIEQEGVASQVKWISGHPPICIIPVVDFTDRRGDSDSFNCRSVTSLGRPAVLSAEDGGF